MFAEAVTRAALLVFSLLPVHASASCYAAESGFAKSDWAHCQQLRDDLFMYYEASMDTRTVKLGLHAANHVGGWSSLAFGGNGGMKGASQIVVRKDGNAWVAEDRFSEDYTFPKMDAQQDVHLLFASEQSGSTSWGVRLKMDSCDEEDYPIEDHSRWMHWALGSSHTFNYHGHDGRSRGQFHANLFKAPSASPSTSGLDEYQLKMPNVKVELGQGGTDPRNPYVCGIFDLTKVMPERDLQGKHHIAQFHPYLNKDSEKYVHHMILLGCDAGSVQAMGYKHGDIIPECESMPRGCYEFKWPWAVGSEPVVFPDNVGMPIGEGQIFMALQMHYYNPDLDRDIFDSSGVRLFLAKTPRSEDAGLLTLNGGTSPEQRDDLPMGQSHLTIAPLVVPPTCTKSWTQDLNIVGVLHHGHLLGKTFEIDVIRNGENLGQLRHEKRYDFNHQSLEEPSLKVLKPQDTLVYSCTYDTTSAKAPVKFGDLTQQEMCWGAVLYYPRQKATDYNHVKPRLRDRTNEYAKNACTTGVPNGSDTQSICEQEYLNRLDNLFAALWPDEEQHPYGYGALDFCNSEWSSEAAFACPSCHEDSSCKAQDMSPFGKSFCKDTFCSEMGFIMWPETSSSNASMGFTECDGQGVRYNVQPKPPPACQAKGQLPNTTEADVDISSAPKVLWTSAFLAYAFGFARVL